MRRFACLICCPQATLDLRVCTASAEGDGGAEDFEGKDRGAGDEGREAKAPGPPRSPLVASPLVSAPTAHTTRNAKPDHLDTESTSCMALRTFEPCTAPTSVPDPIQNPTRALHIEPCPSHATQRPIAQPDLNLAPQSSPLEAAVKSEPAFDAESCGAKSTVPPKRGFVKAVTLLHYSRSAHSQAANALHRAQLCTCRAYAHAVQKYCPHATPHLHVHVCTVAVGDLGAKDHAGEGRGAQDQGDEGGGAKSPGQPPEPRSPKQPS
jgi:hypothetical protein